LANHVLPVIVPSGRTLTRRQALRLGALATAAGALSAPSPAFARRRDPLFEQDLFAATTRASAAAAGWRTTGVLRAPRRFDLIGLRWAAGSHAEAQVRARRRGGKWTPWAGLHVTGDHGPDEGTPPAGTDPVFTGTADEYQLRLRGNPGELRARFVRALPTATLAGRLARRARARISARKQAAPGAAPAMITRTEWGADSVPPRAAPSYGSVQMAFVHHTVNANDYQPEDSAGIVLGIARYHRNSNGWNDIGYNFLVDKYGQIFEGRAGGIDQPVIGAQAQGYNSVSTGVACLGTFSSVAQTEAGMDALARIIGWKLSVHGVPVEGQITVISAGGETNRHPAGTSVTFQRISGHRDGDNTSCPGDALYAQLADLRTRAARYAVASSGLTARAAFRRIRAHRTVDLSGALRFADGSSPGGAPLSIEFQAAGSAWTQIASAGCAPDGGWRTTVTPPTSGTFRAAFPGDAARGPVQSKPVRVDVIPRMSVALDKTQMRRGKRVTVTGTVDPAQLVQCVVERRVGRRWVTVRVRNLDVVGGAFGLRVQLSRAGIYRITAISGTTKRRRRLRVR
jgi:N-acetylmuramoyl-L-alanine amidase